MQPTTYAHLQAADRKPHELKVFELDPRQPLVTGQNPKLIADTSIPFVERIPRRERAAIVAVETLTKRKAAIAHRPDGGMSAIVVVASANSMQSPSANATRAAAGKALVEALQLPEVTSALQSALAASATKGGKR